MVVFVIPDVHLKPWMYTRAAELLKGKPADAIVMLGDIPDDWNCQERIGLYEDTYMAAAEFCRKYKDKTYLCWGNHDLSYRYGAMESGYSFSARPAVLDGMHELETILPEDHIGVMLYVGGVLFSHAGLTQDFASLHRINETDPEKVVAIVNRMDERKLWQSGSPIWARPQGIPSIKAYPAGIPQVIGHTPTCEPLRQGDFLSLDTFSTYRDGSPIGRGHFIWLDTGTMKYKAATCWVDRDAEPA